MTTSRALRQLLYTLVLVLALKACRVLPDPLQLNAEEPWVVIGVYPRVSMVAPGRTAAVRLLVTVPKHDQNRLLCFGYDGTVFRSSCQAHVGQGARYRLETTFQGLPAGEYVAFAELVRVEGEKGQRKSQVATIGFVIQ